ncbi:MAG TPA: B12-binding domain-containing radical SAM protein [Candidatus Aminicenantes bacterium]|nr:B12-binding domain-containing radical SAM protein [Candidatus Aminicenantes bacterium]
MSKKVLLLHCPGDKVYLHDYYTSYSSKANYYWPPTDLVLLSGVLSGFELRVIDAIADRLSAGECEKKILEFSPDAVIFTTGTATWENDIRFITALKPKLRSKILASGSMFLFEAGYFLNAAPAVDAVILDMVSPEIAAFIAGEEKECRALAFRDAEVQSAPPARKDQNIIIPVPRHELFNLAANRSPLARKKPFALVITSVGCPFTCRFCVAGSIRYRYRNTDSIMEELGKLRDMGVPEIMFNDPTFTVSEKRILDLCRKMAAAGMNFSWSANAHVATVSDEMMDAMSRAGCHTVMIGVESAQDEILAGAAKHTTRDKIRDAFRICRKHGIQTLAYFIIGLPGDTRRSILETIRFAKELDCDFASFTVLTPDIGSALRREAIEKGILDPAIRIFDSTCFPVFTAGDLSMEEIWELRQKAVRDFYLRPSYLVKKILGIRSVKDLLFLIDQARSMFLK